MADFALWATACETLLWPAGSFWSAYSGNRDAAVEDVIDADPVAAAVAADRQIATRLRDVAAISVLPDVLTSLQKETELTRHTLAEILKRSGRLVEFRVNPQAFMSEVAKQISRALHDLMLEWIKYEKVPGQHWEMSRIEQEAEKGIVRYLSNLYEVQN